MKMNQKKSVLSIFIILFLAALICCISPVEVRAEDAEVGNLVNGGFTYTLYESGLCVISGSGELNPGDLGRGFVNNGTSLKIEGATSIGNEAFLCCNLSQITIPDSVTSIGEGAFMGCNSLSQITLPNSITCIGNSAFCGCSSLNQVSIPESVTNIGECAFQDCGSLTEISIPDSVTSIGDYSFAYCNQLNQVTIPNSVTSIGVCAFDGCSSLTQINIPYGVTSIGEYAFCYCINLTQATISYSVTSIAPEAFVDCTDLIIKGYSNSYVEQYAASSGIPFESIGSIYAVNFDYDTYAPGEPVGSKLVVAGESYGDLPEIDSQYADQFDGWYTDKTDGEKVTADSVVNLSSDITLYARLKVKSVVDGDFTYTLYNSGLCVISGSGELRPGEAGKAVINNASSLKIEGATSIGDGAFSGCSSLTEITIPSSVTSIGENAFNNIPNLVIKVDKGSYAEQYLKEQGIAYETVGDNNNDPTSDDTNKNPDTDKDTSNTHTHSVVSVDTVQATMTADGKTAGTKCSSCGAVLSGCQVIPKIAVVKLSASAYKWNGKVKTPALTVKASDGTTIPAAFYTVTKSSGRKNVGKYAYKVVFKGNYSGTKTLSFKINPKGATQIKPSALTKGFTAKWKKQAAKMSSSRITGYQVRYSLKSNMSSSKIKTISGYSKTSCKVARLKAKKKYYIQVRTYKTVNKVKYYSTWSAKKAVITK